MTDLGEVWRFTRVRLDQALAGLTDEQLASRPHPDLHTVGEILAHICGVEHYWAIRLGAAPHPVLAAELEAAALDDFLNDRPVPGWGNSTSVDEFRALLSWCEERIEPLVSSEDEALLSTPLTSPIGDGVTARQGFWRLAQHAGYHTGQIWMLRTMLEGR